MSADNGIYILTTPSKNHSIEYRVAHLQAADNIDWDEIHKKYVDEVESYSEYDRNKIRIKNARELFAYAPVFKNEADAFDAAIILYKKFEYTEYGIVRIEIPLEF